MINFDEIRLDYSNYTEVLELVNNHYNFNAGCFLHPHWQEFSARDYSAIVEGSGKFKSLSWMGDGYPKVTDYRQPFEDKYNLMANFSNGQTIDVQSGLYQFYTIENLFKEYYGKFPSQDEGINIIEVGGGYGRLAMFFLTYFGKNCHYVNVDFVPTSLAFSPQVMQQSFPDLKIGRYDFGGDLSQYNYVSLPAWRTREINSDSYNLGLNIHSFQEMKRRSVDFYKTMIWDKLNKDGLLFVVNNPPELGGWYTIHSYYCLENLFEEIYTKEYPIGADWKKICGVPTLERAFVKSDPWIIDTQCSNCDFLYAINDGDVESVCPQCNTTHIHE